jgi:hypothetical protein
MLDNLELALAHANRFRVPIRRRSASQDSASIDKVMWAYQARQLRTW